jgi:hypothetical protein
MATQAQIEANRRNARRSTGPTTVEGKSRAAFNALKHGLTGRQVVLPGENPAEFDAFRSDLIAELSPKGVVQSLLAEHIAVTWWRLMRIPQLESALCHREDRLIRLEDARAEKSSYENDENEPEQPWVKPRDRRAHRAADQKLREAQAEPIAPLARLSELLERRSATLANFDRYSTSLLRSISKALRELKMQQATRAHPLVPAPAIANVDDKFEDAALRNEPSVLQPIRAKLDATSDEQKDVDVDVEHGIANLDEKVLRKDPSPALLPPAYPPVPAPAVANVDDNFEDAPRGTNVRSFNQSKASSRLRQPKKI